MTEDEAKTKWCPFARVASGEPFGNGLSPQPSLLVGWNRREMESLGHRKENLCVGSACMAWRKTGTAKVENRQGKLVDKDEDGTGRWHYDGYCGLAGRP